MRVAFCFHYLHLVVMYSRAVFWCSTCILQYINSSPSVALDMMFYILFQLLIFHISVKVNVVVLCLSFVL
jgi:hypothetical protein